MSLAHLSQDEFEKLYWAKEPFLVIFMADWSSTSIRSEAALSELAPQYEGRLKFIAVDIDSEGELAEKLSVKVVPTTIVFKNREILTSIQGLMHKGMYENKLRNLGF